MELISTQEAKNTQARLGIAFLFAVYSLVAIVTSIPVFKFNPPSVNARHAVMIRIEPSLPSSVPQKFQPGSNQLSMFTEKWWRQHARSAPVINNWWQQHRRVAQLRGKWWQQHQKSRQVRDGWVQTATLVPEPSVRQKNNKALIKQGPISVISKTTLKTKQVIAAVPTAILPSVGSLTLDMKQASKADLEKSSTVTIIEPLEKLAVIGQPSLNSLARLVDKKQQEQPERSVAVEQRSSKVASSSVHAGLLQPVVKSVFQLFKKKSVTEQSNHQCVEGRIAGWSGLKPLQQPKRQIAIVDISDQERSSDLMARVTAAGFTPGSSIFLRIFKDKSELQVWLKKDDRFALFKTYKICRWSGSFGPKLYEGDKQSPEGFYRVNRQLFSRPSWKWKDSFSIGYPNAYDKLHGRTGSLILVHGGCTSTGCFAMTDPVITEVHALGQLAREQGQKKFSVHVYPFKLTKANLRAHKNSPWLPFWNNLKEGYDLFEKTGLPPRVRVCDKRYVFAGYDEDRAGDGWSGKGCYGLVAFVPGWNASGRYASSTRRKDVRWKRSSARSTGCNLNRASCRKFVALKRKKLARKSARRKTKKSLRKFVRKTSTKRRSSHKRRRVAKKVSKRRRSAIRRARAIGRRSSKIQLAH